MPLTATAIRNAKPGEKTIKLFNGRGLYLEVSPAGRKWWRLKYRFDSKEKWLSLSVYPDVSLKDARKRRDGRSDEVTAPLPQPPKSVSAVIPSGFPRPVCRTAQALGRSGRLDPTGEPGRIA